MDTGNYMANQMDDLIEQGKNINDEFNEWLFEACTIKAGRLKEAHDIYPYVDLTDAKLSFLDEMSAKEYSKTIII